LLILSKTKTVSHFWAFNGLLLLHQTRVLPFYCGRLPWLLLRWLPGSTCCLQCTQRSFLNSGHVACSQRSFFPVDMLQTLNSLFSVVDILPGSPLSGHLPFVEPSSCRVHCPYLLLCFFYVGFHGSVVRWACSWATLHFIGRQLTGTYVLWAPHCAYVLSNSKIHSCGAAGIDRSFSSLVVVVPVSTGLVPVVDRLVGMPPLTSIGCCCRDSLL
jgi:hypothetical protein